MLMAEGIMGSLDLVHRLARRGADSLARAFAAAMAGATVLVLATSTLPDGASALGEVTRWLAGLLLAIFVTAAWRPRRRLAVVAGPVVAIVVVALSAMRSYASLETRASFQRPQARRAAATFRQAVDAGAVVITMEEVGRPMENIEYYGGIHSLYFTDLERWRLSLDEVATRLILHHFKPYLLIPRFERDLATVKPPLTIELVADIPPNRNYDYFVAAAFHRGLPMQLWRIRSPQLEAAVQKYEADTGKSLDRSGRSR
jgi:uncharacterized membrane protein YdcZ (DUF606 family)